MHDHDDECMLDELNDKKASSRYEKVEMNKSTQALSMDALNYATDRDIHYKLIVVDCRYYYEFEGGHIKSAINISSPLVMSYLLKDIKELMFEEDFLDSLLAMDDREISLDDLKLLSQEYLNKKVAV